MKKSYKGFPIYALIIIGVLIATQLFSSSFSSQRGQKIEAAKLFEYIDSGVIDAVALESSTAYAHMKASSIPLSAFSNAAYDFSAVISRDTFVETCRQLAARKAGKPLEDITEIDLGFDLIYLPQPATPWLLDMLPYIIMTVGLMVFWLMMMRQQGGGGGKMMTFGHSPARVFEPERLPNVPVVHIDVPKIAIGQPRRLRPMRKTEHGFAGRQPQIGPQVAGMLLRIGTAVQAVDTHARLALARALGNG